MTTPSIVQLPELIAALPADLGALADRLLLVQRLVGHAAPPPAMESWVVRQFGSLEAVTTQTVIRVLNRLTLEMALFNPLRACRPQDSDSAAVAAPDLEAAIAASAGERDIFRDPLHGTTADPFGRIRGQYCVSASNIAKYDGWHGVVIFDEFHPLRFNREQLRDYFTVALGWLAAAHQADPTAQYPLITWNCLWKAGASITHGHMQMMLSRAMAAGHVERWRRAAADYRQRAAGSLFADLGRLHAAVGLTLCQTDTVCGYVTLTPIKDREVLLMVRAPRMEPSALLPLWDAVYAVLRALIDDQGMRSFNLAVYLPPYGVTAEVWDDLPICVRIVDRGDPMTRAVNFGAMELFAGSVVSTDPFAVAAAARLSQTVHF